MALWRRFGSAGFENLIYRCKRCYSVLPGGGAPTAGGVVRLRGFRVLEESLPGGSSMFCYTHFRYYVALGQVMPKPKAEVKGGDWRKPKVETDGGIRINEAIKEREVRLVTDEGHRVVSIQEALYLARTLDLDLVEVQRKVKVEGGAHSNIFKPAVCKLMDYCKEKYKQDVKEKGRAKSKAAIALRNGENKEVRFKAKTELKDLKIKAESVKRLMERGYRVKCTAMPTGKEDEDRGALLLNLLSLIEDISVVESGPHLDTKNAYVIVKHVKFASKKGKKVSKALETVSSVLSTRSNAAADNSLSKDEDDLQTEEEWEAVESDSETEIDDSTKQTADFGSVTDRSGFRAPDDAKAAITFNAKHRISNGIMSASDESINKASGRNASGSHPSQPEPYVTETNRYSRPTNRDSFYPGKAAVGNQQRIPVRNSRREIDGHGQSNPNDQPAHSHYPNSSSRHGGFSASQGSGSNDRTNPNAPNLPQQRYGVFSSAKSYQPVDERRTREMSSDRASRSNSSSTSSYGIFGAHRIISSDDQMRLRDASRDNDAGKSGNASPPPSPRFGIFTSSKKKASSGNGRVGDKS